MLDYAKYENKIMYVSKPFYFEKELKDLLDKDSLSSAQKLRVKELKEEIGAFKRQRDLYYNEEDRLYNLWKNDLYEEYGVKDNPKADKAFSIAWEHGYDCGGYRKVERYFSDLVELIK